MKNEKMEKGKRPFRRACSLPHQGQQQEQCTVLTDGGVVYES
jgi:hypothetical protein